MPASSKGFDRAAAVATPGRVDQVDQVDRQALEPHLAAVESVKRADAAFGGHRDLRQHLAPADFNEALSLRVTGHLGLHLLEQLAVVHHQLEVGIAHHDNLLVVDPRVLAPSS